MCLSRFARGRVPSCVRPSVDVSIFLLWLDKNAGDDVQSMVEKEIESDSDISMDHGWGATRYCRVNVIIFITLAAKLQWSEPLPVHERTAIPIIVDSATAHSFPSEVVEVALATAICLVAVRSCRHKDRGTMLTLFSFLQFDMCRAPPL